MNVGLLQVIIAFVITVSVVVYGHFRSEEALRQWAAANGFSISSKKRALFPVLTPLRFSSSFNAVYRVRVIDRNDKEKECWVRFRHVLRGFDVRTTDVIWDD
jgi:hypothetical protein